ncbi:MAG: hypothetical protein EF813_06330 [Methanosarcinales archaeon]|nr:MAG: hypothetical protein EF813_06330 [Methanosarcinales archaeon]
MMVARIRRTSRVLPVVLLCTIAIALVAAQPLFAPAPPIPFLIAGSAVYENGIVCGNFTVGITNLNTSRTWDADTSHNHYKLVLNRSDICSGDVLQFDSINRDAGTTNISTYTVSDADQLNLIHNITFKSVDAVVLILDSDETIHYQPLFLNRGSDFILMNATEIACGMLNQAFESSGGNVTGIDGIKSPVVHLYDSKSDGWTNVSEDHPLTAGDVIIWSCEDAELPALLPELSIGELTVGSDLHTHFETTVGTTVMNRGATISGGFCVVLVDNGEVIDLRTLPSLSPMEEATVSFDWVTEDAGDHTIRIEIDYDNQVDEWYEDNNILSGDVVVGETLVIRVPDDYTTIQWAVDNSTTYTVIHVDEGDYESRLTITNRDHLKILGSGEDTRIIAHGSPAGRARPNLIGIVGSSNIELDGFVVRVDSSYGSQFPEGWRAINITESEKISLTNLLLTHASWADSSSLIRIEGSTDCLIADNFMSGSLSPPSWGFRFATPGVLITSESDDNTIYNNMICDCCYTIKVQGNNNTIYANGLFFAEAGDSPENTFAIDTGQNNHWNASSPLSYRHNNTTFVNYIGNYWDSWTGADPDDDDDDGILDVPHNISNNTSDYYPLCKPYAEEYYLTIKSITLPQRAYAGVKDRVTAVISQNSQRITDITVNLTVNNEMIESRRIKLLKSKQKTLEFVRKPEGTGICEVSLVASINDSVVLFQTERSITTEIHELPYKRRGHVAVALKFLQAKQTPSSGSIGPFSTSAWAVLAIAAAREDPRERKLYGRSLADYLAAYPLLPYNDFVIATFEDCARTLLAISVLGDIDPTNFGNVNYLTMVKSYHDGVQFGDPVSVNDDALGILALTACGDRSAAERINKSRGYIVSHQNEDGGWSRIIENHNNGNTNETDDILDGNTTNGNTTDGNTTSGNTTNGNAIFEVTSNLRTTAFIIQALVAAGEPPDSNITIDALEFLRRNIGHDGNLSDAVTTACAVQAIIAMGENPLEWRNTSINDSVTPIDYLMSLQQPDGSFNYTTNQSFFPRYTTAKVVPALATCPCPPRITDIDSYPMPDISPTGKIEVPDTIYVNTSCTVHGTLRCDGGMFNVSLLEDGVSTSVTTVRSIWYDPEISDIPFSLEWVPSSDGFVNITVFVDSDGRVDERYEENNNLTREVYVSLPDLAIADVVLPDSIYVNVTNLINANVSGITDEHFNVSFVADGVEVDRRMVAGIRSSTNLSYEWRPGAKGNHNISIVADPDGEVREVCETNNAATLDCMVILPDLVPVCLTPDVAFVRARNNITVTIDGTAEEFNVSLVENGAVVANATNITCYGQTSVNLTYKPTSLGNHTVTAVIDSDGGILETEETNNNLSSVINVTRTDLVPIRILPDIMYLNKTNRIIIPVTGTAEGFNATLIAYARDMPGGMITVRDGTGNATNTTNVTNLAIINATDLDTYNDGNLTIWWQPDFQGWHNLTVVVDPDNNVNETNESNNNHTGEAFVANEIQLELVSPRIGEICGGIHPIKWKALHDKNLTIDLLYSSNYGIEWTMLASNLTCDPRLTANLTENLIKGGNATNATDATNAANASNTTNLTHAVNYNGVYLWDTTNHTDGEYLIRITARWYILRGVYTSNTVIVLNGDAASGGLGGNARYFDCDTPDEPHLAWVSEDIFAGGSTSIVVADDTVFVYCTGNEGFSSSDYTYMVALNATNGEMLWATEIAPAEYGSWSSPAYHNGSIFIASGMHVYRIAGRTGRILWDYTFSDCCANCNAGPSISGGRVYVTSFYRSLHTDPSMTCPESSEGNLFCLDVETGGELWNTSTYLPPIRHLGTPTPKYGRIYYGRGGDLYCLTLDGAVVWNTSLKHDVYSAPVIVDGVVYASTYEFGMGFGGFNCLDAFNGSILWNYPVQRTDSTPAYFAPGDSDKKYIYVVGGCSGFSGSGVYCFNATNGSLIWGSEKVGSWTNSPAVSRDAKVFVGVSAGNFNYNGLKCLDAYNGTELWSSPYGGSSPYIAYGRIYTIGGNRLYAFGGRDQPDLVVTAASAGGGVVHATIKNIGTGGTNESFRVALRQWGRVIDEHTVDALDAGESVAVTLSLHGACGNLEVYADSGGDIPERDEYNNMMGVTVPCDDGGGGEPPGNDPPGNSETSPNTQVRQGIGPRGSGYLGKYFDFGDGTDKDATEAGIEAVINETETTSGMKQKAKGYPMGTELKTGGAGGGYVSYTMAILAILILLGLLVQGIRKERGRYRRYVK